MPSIDLNADVGEECGDDTALMAVVTTANVAAGGHAGGGDVLARTVAAAVHADVRVGAHPSYPDRLGFGRVSRLHEHTRQSLTHFLRDQILGVAEHCVRRGSSLTHVKAHGALYHDVAHDPEASAVFTQTVAEIAAELDGSLAVLGPPSPELRTAADRVGLRYVVEAFGDRRYLADGTLVPRSDAGAVLIDPREVVEQVLSLARDRQVRTSDGTTIRIEAASICLHGDTPDAVALASAVRSALEDAGIHIAHPSGP